MSGQGAIIEIHEDVNYLEAHEEVVEIIEVYNWGTGGDSLSGLATAEGQIPVTLGPDAWGVVEPPASTGLVWTSDLGVPGKARWAASSGEIEAHALDSHTSPTDNTDLNASASAHGLLPKLSDDETDFLNGKGEWAQPGDVVGPASATDHAVVRWDGTTGKLVQDSLADLADDGTLSALICDLGGEVYNVKGFGAVGDGTTDDTAAIQAVLDALPADGARVFLPPGVYRITSMLTMGNGGGSGTSTINGINLLGAGTGRNAQFSGSTYGGASILKWDGSSGGTLLKVNGAVHGCRIANLALDGNQLAGTLLHVNFGHGLRVENVDGYQWQGGYAVKIMTTGTIGAGWMEQFWSHVRMMRPYGSTACGLDIASAGSLNVCELTMISCVFERSNGSSAIGIRLGYCDHITFTRVFTPVYGGGTTSKFAIVVQPISGYTAFPNNVTFIGSPIMGAINYVDTYAWSRTDTPALIFYPFYTADSQVQPPSGYVNGVLGTLPLMLCVGFSDTGYALWTPGWVYATLLNSWANYDGNSDSGNYHSAAYSLDQFGYVHLRGLIRSGTLGLAALTLPSGYRPGKIKIFGQPCSNGSAYEVASVQITTAGNVVPSGPYNSWLSLEGISFKIG